MAKRSVVMSENQRPRQVRTKAPVRAEKNSALDWKSLLDSARFDDHEPPKWSDSAVNDHRVPHERDFDRVAFCSPVRRLKDKTQVFPLDLHDGVRTRLTHSLEVANLARSMGVAIAERSPDLQGVLEAKRSVPALLGTVALVHDLGNPPFGHQGETAIRSWADSAKEKIKKFAGGKFNNDKYNDFLTFEGNAQGFRVLARLQHQNYQSGLRLTSSTLAAFMKYPWGSSHKVARTKGKFGYFHSEESVYEWARKKVSLAPEQRHPLSYIMEICDDIAYSVLDVEDAVKKDIVSVSSLISYLEERDEFSADSRVSSLLGKVKQDLAALNKKEIPAFDGEGTSPLSIREIRDSTIELMRTYAIGYMVNDAVDNFLDQTSRSSTLTDISKEFDSRVVMKAFKGFARERVYKHPEVLRAELAGHRVIPELMDAFLDAVINVRRGVASKQDEYIFSLISPNYVRVCQESATLGLPEWYRLVQLVCDQVSGMTDSYCVRLHSALKDLELL